MVLEATEEPLSPQLYEPFARNHIGQMMRLILAICGQRRAGSEVSTRVRRRATWQVGAIGQPETPASRRLGRPHTWAVVAPVRVLAGTGHRRCAHSVRRTQSWDHLAGNITVKRVVDT